MCDDNRNKINTNPKAASEDILNVLISSAQNANCSEQGSICCATKFIKNLSVDYVDEPDPCESFALDGEFVVNYSQTIQVEKFNYT